MRVLNRMLYLPRKRATVTQLSSITAHRLTPNKSNIFVLLNRSYSASSPKKDNQLVESTSGEEKAVQTTVIQNVKEATKTVSYLGIVIVGFSIGVSVFYAIFSELFSSKSPNKVYSKAFDYVSNDPRVRNILGEQIKGFGEETRRGRRQHVSHVKYEKDGMKLLRMRFYVKGSRESGTVNLEMYENEKGKYEYRYLFLITDGLIKKTVILEDNRDKASSVAKGAQSSVYPELSELPELDLSSK